MSDALTYLPLRCEQLQIVLAGRIGLQDISFELRSPGITAIMGPNGSGKTLLLKSCAGLLPASKGRVIWQTTPNPPIITWVPQSAVLLNRSVIENIYRLLKHQGSLEDKKIRLRRCEEALAWVGIGHLKQQNALTLSTGERQLLALARAWALSPKILLLDEPSANLDPMRQTQMNSLIRALSERCKIIFSTHSVSQARELATDVLLLKQGRLLTHCNAATFFDSEYSRMTDSLCLS